MSKAICRYTGMSSSLPHPGRWNDQSTILFFGEPQPALRKHSRSPRYRGKRGNCPYLSDKRTGNLFEKRFIFSSFHCLSFFLKTKYHTKPTSQLLFANNNMDVRVSGWGVGIVRMFPPKAFPRKRIEKRALLL